MHVDLMLFADMANVDVASKFNIIGEFNMIFAVALPSPPVNMALVTRLVAAVSEGNRHKIAIAVVNADGKQVVRTPDIEVLFAEVLPGTSRDLRAQLVAGISRVSFPAYGTYDFQLLCDGRVLGSREMYVLKAPEMPQPQLPFLGS